jgi:hypothetical protein
MKKHLTQIERIKTWLRKRAKELQPQPMTLDEFKQLKHQKNRYLGDK